MQWRRDPSKFTGRPRLPQYVERLQMPFVNRHRRSVWTSCARTEDVGIVACSARENTLYFWYSSLLRIERERKRCVSSRPILHNPRWATVGSYPKVLPDAPDFPDFPETCLSKCRVSSLSEFLPIMITDSTGSDEKIGYHHAMWTYRICWWHPRILNHCYNPKAGCFRHSISWFFRW